jgi:hypothetical protein
MTDIPNPISEAAPLPQPSSAHASTTAAYPAFAVRIWCAFTFLLCTGMLAVGFYLTPSPDGFGKNHGLFGMPPCGFYQTTGYPCPTCGCTTAVSHFAHGHLVASLFTQPFGFAVALLAVVLIPLTSFGLVTGKWIGPSMFALSWYWRRWLYTGITIFVLGWLYKIIMITMAHP